MYSSSNKPGRFWRMSLRATYFFFIATLLDLNLTCHFRKIGGNLNLQFLANVTRHFGRDVMLIASCTSKASKQKKSISNKKAWDQSACELRACGISYSNRPVVSILI